MPPSPMNLCHHLSAPTWSDYSLACKTNKNLPISFSPYYGRVEHAFQLKSQLGGTGNHLLSHRLALRVISHNPPSPNLPLTNLKLWLHQCHDYCGAIEQMGDSG